MDPILDHLTKIWVRQLFLASFIAASDKTLFQAIILWNLKEK